MLKNGACVGSNKIGAYTRNAECSGTERKKATDAYAVLIQTCPTISYKHKHLYTHTNILEMIRTADQI
jgi:hypothetical protein